jgi:transposase
MHPEITIVWADLAILPRRWVVERSLAWIMHARRHARDRERLVQHSSSTPSC